MLDFARTMMGRTLFDATLPGLVRELARLNDNLERLAKLRERAINPSADGVGSDAESDGRSR